MIFGDTPPEPLPTDRTLDDLRAELGEPTTVTKKTGGGCYAWWRRRRYVELNESGRKRTLVDYERDPPEAPREGLGC